MAYTEAAIALRRCTATTKAGAPCRGWAMWGDPLQRCAQHAGQGHRGPQPNRFARLHRRRKRPHACRCAAYAFPHRPGAGLCRWPEEPTHRLTTPAHTHRYMAVRLRRGRYEERGERWRGGHVERIE
jgi:hypothetical protein